MDKPRLLPCPFCGADAYISYQPDDDWPRCVEGENEACEAIGPWAQRGQDHKQAMEYVVKGWNTRIERIGKLSEQRAETKP